MAPIDNYGASDRSNDHVMHSYVSPDDISSESDQAPESPMMTSSEPQSIDGK